MLDRRELLQAAAGALVAGSALGRLGRALAAGVDPRVAELARLVSGPVIAPGSAAYGAARLVYNERFDGVRPLAVVRVERTCRTCRPSVALGAAHGVAIVPRSGGHSYARLVDRHGRRRRRGQAARHPGRGRDGGDRRGAEADRRLRPARRQGR